MRERQAKIVPEPGQSVDLDDVQGRIATLLLEAVSCVAPARVSDTVRGWLARLDLSSLPPAMEAALMAEALAMATIVAVFTPTASGTTAVDRLARRCPPDTPASATAQGVLGRTGFRLLQIEGIVSAGIARLRDVASGEAIQVGDETMQAAFTGLHIAAWLAPLPDGRHVFVGAVTPLDEAGVEVAMGFVRPGRSGLINPLRCAEAVYRHVLRHGTPRVPGLNEPLLGDDDELAEAGDGLDQLALQWAESGHQRSPDDVQFVRAETSLECIVAMLASAANTREHMLGVFAEFETNLRRERQLEGIKAAKERGVYKGRKPTIDAAELGRLREEEQLGPAAIARRLGIGRASVYRVLGNLRSGDTP